MICIHCDNPAEFVDVEYDEGYCARHFSEQQRSSEPVPHWKEVRA